MSRRFTFAYANRRALKLRLPRIGSSRLRVLPPPPSALSVKGGTMMGYTHVPNNGPGLRSAFGFKRTVIMAATVGNNFLTQRRNDRNDSMNTLPDGTIVRNGIKSRRVRGGVA
jgi:hypothetical protein